MVLRKYLRITFASRKKKKKKITFAYNNPLKTYVLFYKFLQKMGVLVLARGLGVKVKGRVEKQDCNEQ